MADESLPSREWQQPEPIIPRPDPMTTSRTPEREPTIQLRDYFEMRITSVEEKSIMRVEALAKELAVSLQSSGEAIRKAELATEKRFDSVNEFRLTLSDQTSTFASKASFDSLESKLLDRIDAMRNEQSAELKGLRDTLFTKIEAVAAASQIKIDAERQANLADSRAMWKMIWGLAASIAVIEAVIKFGT